MGALIKFLYARIYKPIAMLPNRAYAALFLGDDPSRLDKQSWGYFWWRELFHSAGGLIIASLGILAAHWHEPMRIYVAYLMGMGTGFMEGVHFSRGQTLKKTVIDLCAWAWPTFLLAQMI